MRSAAPPLRGALIGCGYVSRFHLEAWPRVPKAKLVAVCDLNPDLAARAAAMIPEARTYTDSADLFEREEALDFVEICTQPESHRGLVELAARHGVDILCQKPAATAGSDFTRHDRRLRVGGRPAHDSRKLAVPALVSRTACRDRFRSDRPADPRCGSPTATRGPCVRAALRTSPTWKRMPR